MPRIIRKALYQKLTELPELKGFQGDFELLTGMKLGFVDELGLGGDSRPGPLSVCAAVQASESGRMMCARSRHALLASAKDHAASMICDLGLAEVAIPLNISGIRAGYFVFYGTAPVPVDSSFMQKARHLLRKNGIEIDETELAHRLSTTPVLSPDRLRAFARIIAIASTQIGLKITDRLGNPDAAMPPAVLKACGFIRAKALVEDVSLTTAARHCGCSEGHLSRLFHHATGLTFREYLAQVRIEHARAQLLHTNRNVTEIAYASGFQSLSQFHRVFRKAHGTSPGEFRSRNAATAGSKG